MSQIVELMASGTAIAACVVVAIIPLAVIAAWWSLSGGGSDETGS